MDAARKALTRGALVLAAGTYAFRVAGPMLGAGFALGERARELMNGAVVVLLTPLVARWHKKFARRLADPRPLSESERDEGYACFDTEDYRIGFKAFLAKTKPEFKGS